MLLSGQWTRRDLISGSADITNKDHSCCIRRTSDSKGQSHNIQTTDRTNALVPKIFISSLDWILLVFCLTIILVFNARHTLRALWTSGAEQSHITHISSVFLLFLMEEKASVKQQESENHAPKCSHVSSIVCLMCGTITTRCEVIITAVTFIDWAVLLLLDRLIYWAGHLLNNSSQPSSQQTYWYKYHTWKEQNRQLTCHRRLYLLPGCCRDPLSSKKYFNNQFVRVSSKSDVIFSRACWEKWHVESLLQSAREQTTYQHRSNNDVTGRIYVTGFQKYVLCFINANQWNNTDSLQSSAESLTSRFKSQTAAFHWKHLPINNSVDWNLSHQDSSPHLKCEYMFNNLNL